MQGSVVFDQPIILPGLGGEEGEQGIQAEDATALDPVSTLPEFNGDVPAHSFHDIQINGLDALVSAAVGIQHSPISGGSIGASHGSPYNHISPSTNSSPGNSTVKPLANVEEACLLRYFIEELSPWVWSLFMPEYRYTNSCSSTTATARAISESLSPYAPITA